MRSRREPKAASSAEVSSCDSKTMTVTRTGMRVPSLKLARTLRGTQKASGALDGLRCLTPPRVAPNVERTKSNARSQASNRAGLAQTCPSRTWHSSHAPFFEKEERYSRMCTSRDVPSAIALWIAPRTSPCLTPRLVRHVRLRNPPDPHTPSKNWLQGGSRKAVQMLNRSLPWSSARSSE